MIGHIISESDHVLIVGGHYGLEAIVAGMIVDGKGKLFITAPTNLDKEIIRANI